MDELAAALTHKHNDYVFQQPEFTIGDIQTEAFRHTCIAASNTAGGLDGWDPIDFKLLSPHSFQLLVDLLNAIEL